MRCTTDGGEALLLVLIEQAGEVREKTLLGLCNLLLQGVNLQEQYADLSRVASGIEQRVDLLLSLGDPLKQRSHSCLPGLKQLPEHRLLRRLKL